MIPLRLSLTNFLSYRDTIEVEFEALHLACIAGANGAGKSTLLDAMIWALFGKSRVASDDDLVNRAAGLGAMAEVRFTFDMAGNAYRVIRRKRVGKTTELELQQCVDGDLDGRWKTMTEARVIDTQAAIRDLLQMSYDVFTNASFILQDKASDFTVKTPDKRKEVLSAILGVSQWEKYREAAAARRKTAEVTADSLRRSIEEIDVELAQEVARRQALGEAEEQEATLQSSLSAREARLGELRMRKAQANQQRDMVVSLAGSLSRARQELSSAESDLGRRREELASVSALLAREPAIVERYEAWQAAETAAAEWQDIADRHAELERQRRPHEMAVERERIRLTEQEQALARQSAEVAKRVSERTALATALEADRPQLAQVTSELEAAAAQEAAFSEARTRLVQLEGERKAWDREAAVLRSTIAAWQGLDVERTRIAAEIETAELALADRLEGLTRLDEQQKLLAETEAALGQLVADRERITREGKAIRARIDGLMAEAGSTCPLCGQVMTEDHRASVIAQWNTEHEERVTAYRQIEGERLRREAEKEVLVDALRKRPRLQAELSAAQNDLAQRKARLQQVEEGIAARDGSTTAAQLAELEKLLADDAELMKLKEQVQTGAPARAKREALDRARAALQERVARANAQLEQIDAAAKRWSEIEEPALAAVRQQLQEGNYAAEAQLALADVDRQLAELGYDPAAHELARRSRTELVGADADYQRLQTAREQVKMLDDMVADLEARQKHWRDQATETETQHDAAEALWRSLSAELTELDAVEREVTGLREAVVEAVRRAGSARQAVSVLENQRQRRSGLVVEHKQATQLVSQFRVLEDSFGRKGVQAWLIEMALPEIEDRANVLLDRLSNGAMRVSFSTQKKLKSKDAVAETLDITIADGEGERPYENYSGGEKFRINFAIRLALSQVLAHRAGTQLRTLVIDEGFGSQDPEGRQRLVEAINLVQNEFACILVITHVDELRDAFPARIEVEKTAAGSQVKVVVA